MKLSTPRPCARNQLEAVTWDSTGVLLEAGTAIETTAKKLPCVAEYRSGTSGLSSLRRRLGRVDLGCRAVVSRCLRIMALRDHESGGRMLKEREGISRHALAANLEVEMIGRRSAGAAHSADHRPGLHLIACSDEVRAVVGVDRAEPVRVRDLDYPAIGGLASAEDHGARCRCADGGAPRGLDVNAAMRPQGRGLPNGEITAPSTGQMNATRSA